MENDEHLDAVFYALADRRRRQLLAELAAGPKPVSALAAALGLRISAMSKHIAVLETAGLVVKTRRGRQIYCHLNFDAWRVVAQYIAMHAKFWSGRLDELETYLKEAGAQ
jgi:DNA-binding transcriptional ArsR family regulator